jgi:ABC-2 type transport system permease protein
VNSGVLLLLRMRHRMAWNTLWDLRNHSKTKIVVILLFALALWAGLYWLFYDGFRFMDRGMGGVLEGLRGYVLDVMFAVFFLSLFVMLGISNGIIAYGTLFRSEETAFLVARPFRAPDIFAYKMIEGLLFSSWAFLFLALPLIAALGVYDRAPWYYYPGALVFLSAFALLAAAAGGAATLLVGRFLTQSPKRVLALFLAVILAVTAVWLFNLISSYRETMERSGEVWMQRVLGRLSLSRSPLLPTYWVGDGLLALARGEWRLAGYRLVLLGSTALFAGMAAIHMARWMYTSAYHRTQALNHRRRSRAAGGFYRGLERCLPALSDDLRALIVKDVKTFFRDPVQWSQVLVFFGLLAVYFINMRNLRYDIDHPFWKNLISLLNLVATSLTLSTFTSRFIFPLLSLEGRKFWILGLLPIARRNILYSKFWFAFAGSFVMSESLMLLSDAMLGLPAGVMGLHALMMLLVCAGLSALSVGIGALYPNLREDNPSKIVSGFGGTLNLVLSVCYVTLLVTFMAVPYHVSSMSLSGGEGLRMMLAPGICIALLIGAFTVAVPLALGVRAFEKLEV